MKERREGPLTLNTGVFCIGCRHLESRRRCWKSYASRKSDHRCTNVHHPRWNDSGQRRVFVRRGIPGRELPRPHGIHTPTWCPVLLAQAEAREVHTGIGTAYDGHQPRRVVVSPARTKDLVDRVPISTPDDISTKKNEPQKPK